ncbi:MAG TPA: MscL family protein [Acidimicrobiales bacterium]|nr:MscL family protein [Acidimicrobiales bacterium]
MTVNQSRPGHSSIITGFKNFLMRGDIIVVAVGLAIALAFSTLIAAFTSSVINPLVNRIGGKHPVAFGIQLGTAGNKSTFMDFGAFISAIIYFIIYVAIVYFLIVMPYKAIQARRGVSVFGEPAPAKSCPYCLSEDLPMAATKCRFCGSELTAL